MLPCRSDEDKWWQKQIRTVEDNRKGGKVEIWIFFLQCNGLDQESGAIENTSRILSNTVLNPCVYPLSLSMFSWSLSKCFPDRNVSTFYPSPNWWHMWTLPRRNLVAQSISGTSRFIDWEIPRRTMAARGANVESQTTFTCNHILSVRSPTNKSELYTPLSHGFV